MGYHEMAAEREADGRTRKLTVMYMPWEKSGQIVIGKFISEAVIKSKKNEGSYKQYVFHTDDGMIKFQCGGFFDNDQGAAMQRGGVYSILFQGKKKIESGNTVNAFELVEIAAPGDTKAPAAKNTELDLGVPVQDPTD